MQYSAIAKISILLLAFIVASYVLRPAGSAQTSGVRQIGNPTLGFISGGCFLVGALCSAAAGYISMWVSVSVSVSVCVLADVFVLVSLTLTVKDCLYIRSPVETDRRARYCLYAVLDLSMVLITLGFAYVRTTISVLALHPSFECYFTDGMFCYRRGMVPLVPRLVSLSLPTRNVGTVIIKSGYFLFANSPHFVERLFGS